MSITRKYLYAMKLRPFSMGTYPKKDFIKALINEDANNTRNHDLLIYDRKLNKDLENEWELEYIGVYDEI